MVSVDRWKTKTQVNFIIKEPRSAEPGERGTACKGNTQRVSRDIIIAASVTSPFPTKMKHHKRVGRTPHWNVIQYEALCPIFLISKLKVQFKQIHNTTVATIKISSPDPGIFVVPFLVLFHAVEVVPLPQEVL